jgi:hypothetical protein
VSARGAGARGRGPAQRAACRCQAAWTVRGFHGTHGGARGCVVAQARSAPPLCGLPQPPPPRSLRAASPSHCCRPPCRDRPRTQLRAMEQPLDAAAADLALAVDGAAPDLLALVFERLPQLEQCMTVSRLAHAWRRWAVSPREQLRAHRRECRDSYERFSVRDWAGQSRPSGASSRRGRSSARASAAWPASGPPHAATWSGCCGCAPRTRPARGGARRAPWQQATDTSTCCGGCGPSSRLAPWAGRRSAWRQPAATSTCCGGCGPRTRPAHGGSGPAKRRHGAAIFACCSGCVPSGRLALGRRGRAAMRPATATSTCCNGCGPRTRRAPGKRLRVPLQHTADTSACSSGCGLRTRLAPGVRPRATKQHAAATSTCCGGCEPKTHLAPGGGNVLPSGTRPPPRRPPVAASPRPALPVGKGEVQGELDLGIFGRRRLRLDRRAARLTHRGFVCTPLQRKKNRCLL